MRRLILIAYALPAMGAGMTRFLVLMYLMKFSTDVLMVAPAAIGFAIGASRVWDAVTDPLAGYLSDRTRHRLGRRRPWLLVGAVALPLATLALWSPPRWLDGDGLAVWMGLSLLVFFTANTIHAVPYDSLGAELTTDHHQRTRVFGYRHAAFMVGMFSSLGLVAWLTSTDDKRGVATVVAFVCGGLACATTLVTALFVREPETAKPPRARPFGAMLDVWRNHSARLLLMVFFIARCGSGALSALGAYLADYLVGDESMLPWLIGVYALAGLSFVPVGAALSRRFSKGAVWSWSMVASAVAFLGLYFVGEGDILLVVLCAGVVGMGDTGESMLGRSMQADVIDADEVATGERKEGVYFAVWGLVQKSAYGVSLLIAGIALQVSGYEPNVTQSGPAEQSLRLLLSVFPAAAYLVAFVLARRYTIGEAEHRRLRAQLSRPV